MKMLGNGTQQYVELHRMLFNPYRLYTVGQLDDILRGALDTHAAKADPYFSEEVTTLIKSYKSVGRFHCRALVLTCLVTQSYSFDI
jgi:hypothetical protein